METIVIGIDGSEGAGHALKWAVAEALLHDAELEAIYATGLPRAGNPLGSAPADLSAIDDSARAIIDEAISDHLRRHPDLRMRSRIEHGPAASALVDAAADADLAVVGSRGIGGFKGLVLGSVSRHLSHHPPCPVAVLHPPREPSDQQHGRVTVGIDGSAAAAEAVRFAVEEAQTRRAALHVIHAWDVPDLATLLPVFPDDPRPEQLEAGALALLEQALGGIGEPDGVVVEPVVTRAHPAEALIRGAAESDLLVVGARGDDSYGSVLLGSVSHACAEHSPCPVVIVPAGATA